MRRLPLAAAALVAAATAAHAQPPTPFNDAAVHAVQFVDATEGWAVGDDGVVWHSIDGGATWERQKSGTRASLRGLHFQSPYTGWAVGRQELPNGAGSVGVLLHTTDGGIEWREVGVNVLPGLHAVRFFDENNGLVVGDGSDAFPGGLFTTADGGKTWFPARTAAGAPAWRALDMPTPAAGVVGGAWSKLGRVAVGGADTPAQYADADVDPLGGRAIHAVKLGDRRAWAVGDGGAVLVSADGGRKWGFADVGLPRDALSACDFRCVAAVGSHVWVAGRPGTFVLHSGDGGATWETQKTGTAVPLNGLHFASEAHGWAVGELGTILATTDGGKTWSAKRAGGQRAGVLFVHAAGKSAPLDTLSLLGHGDGYLTTALGVMAADPATADPKRQADDARLRQAVRLAGGAAAETCWCFPLPAHAAGLPPRELMAIWDQAHGGKAETHLLRQVVLALRTWQPEVVVSDVVATDAAPADVLVLHAAKEAFKQAADPNAFPEQITALGLKPWAAKKLYALSPEATDAPVKLDLSEFHRTLADSPRDFAEPAFRVLGDGSLSVDRRCFRLIAHRLPGSEAHANLTDGINLAPGGAGRREQPAAPADPDALTAREAAARARRQLQAVMATADPELGGPDKAMAALGAKLKTLPDDVAARTVHTVAGDLARAGKWAEAREMFAVLADQYPGHPLAAEAFRWLAKYHSSAETRRRAEVQHAMIFRNAAFQPTGPERRDVALASGASMQGSTLAGTEAVYRQYDPELPARWHGACLDIEPKLAALGPVYSRDPAAWLCFLSARRQLGKYADAETFLVNYFKANPGAAAAEVGVDPWRDCLAAELWLTNPNAVPAPPKPVGYCRGTDTRPFLDGKLDDPCWADLKPLPLKPATGDKSLSDGYATEAKFAYDDQFVYIAVACKHPAGAKVPPAAKRPRDADLTGRDRVDVLLDLDRDYQTYYRFQIDHRGCVAEDCCGDRSWNPKYFVAFHAADDGWTAELAVPLAELTADKPSHAKTWAVNVSRVVPGRGVLSWSGPADADPRPEGMGLVKFTQTR